VTATSLVGGENSPVITILNGQPLMRELRTDHIATDVNGDFWYFYIDEEGDYKWSSSPISRNDVHIDSATGKGYVKYTYGKEKITYLEMYYGESEYEDDKNIKVLYYRLPVFSSNGYSYVRVGADGSLLQESKDSSTMTMRADMDGTRFEIGLISAAKGDVTIKMTDPSGSILDGDKKGDDTDIYAPEGTVTIISASAGQIGTDRNPLEITAKIIDTHEFVSTETVSTDTHLYFDNGDVLYNRNIIVDGVVWDVKTFDGSIIFADSTDAEEGKYDLTVINGGAARIATNKNVDENGTATDNDAAASEGRVLIRNVSVYAADDGTESTLAVDAAGDIGLNDIDTDGADISLTSRNGSVTAADADLSDSRVTVNAAENAGFRDVSVSTSVLTVDAGTDITMRDLEADTSDVSLTSANGSFAAANVNAESSILTVSAAGTGSFDDVIAAGSELTVVTGGDITMGDLDAGDSDVSLTSVNGGFTAADMNAVNSTVNVNAAGDGEIREIRAYGSHLAVVNGGDLRFDDAIVRATELILTAGGVLGMRPDGGMDCSEYGQHAFIQIDEDDTAAASSITLTGKGSIGERNSTLIVDIPESITLKIPETGDLFLESLELIPQKKNSKGEFETIRITLDDPMFGPDRVIHPDNPKINEFTGTEVESREEISGDYLAFITDELHDQALPFMTTEELAAVILEQKGSEWASVIDAEEIKKILADTQTNTELTAFVTEEMIADILTGLRTDEETASSADKALAEWLVSSTEDYPELRERLESGDVLTDEEILEIVSAYQPESDEEKEVWRNIRIESIIAAKDEDGGNAGTDALWDAITATESDETKAALLTMLLEQQVTEGSAIKAISDITALIESLLTEEELAALKQASMDEAEIPAEAEAGYDDAEPKKISIEIGKATGSANVYSDGAISIRVTGDSDLTAEYIRSERGDVSIDVGNGSLTGTGSGTENILGADVRLTASGDIGAESDALDLQQRDNGPAVVVNLKDTDENGKSTGIISMDENGNWMYGVTLAYSWVRKDVEDAAMRLDAESDNGSVTVNETVGGTGIGTVSAAENVSITTDGDLTDVLTEEEKAAGEDNITSGNDTVINVPNGAAGTAEDPIEVNIGRHMTADTRDDIHVTSGEDLSITADTQDGIVTVRTDGDLKLDNTADAAHGTGDITVYAQAGGSAEVTIAGSIADSEIEAGNDALVISGGDVTETDVTAGGTAAVEADGSILAESGSTLITGDDVRVTADADADGEGTVGTEERPLLVDTAAGDTGKGSLTASAAEVFVEEITGDLVIDSVTATDGKAVITAPGDITDKDSESKFEEAEEAQKEASDADNIASAAEDKAEVLDENAAELEAKADDAEEKAAEAADKAKEAREKAEEAAKAVTDTEDKIRETEEEIARIKDDPDMTEEEKAEKTAELEKQKAELSAGLDDRIKAAEEAEAEAVKLEETAAALKETADEARTEADEARKAADEAYADAAQKRSEADAAQQKADELLRKAQENDPSVKTAGDLILHAGGDIGKEDNALDLDVEGRLYAGAPGDLFLTNAGDLKIADLDADGNADSGRRVSLTADGDISSDSVIKAAKADVNTLSMGSAGTAEKPLRLDVAEVEGTIAEDAVIVNRGDLRVNDLSAGGKLDLTAGGSITAGDAQPETANITAEEAVIRAGGDAGTRDEPLVTDTGKLSVSAENVYIRSITDLEIENITGREVEIDVEGKTTAGQAPVNITADNLRLTSFGSIGTEQHPLIVRVSGDTVISNIYGDQYVTNIYTPYRPVREEEPEDMSAQRPAHSNIPGAKGDKKEEWGDEEENEWALTNFIVMIANIFLALALLWIYLRKRRKGQNEAADLVNLAALVPAAASLAAYLMTEDMSGKMIAADKWTALMLLFFSAEAGILYYSLRYREDTDE
jgi:hypothetical protein